MPAPYIHKKKLCSGEHQMPGAPPEDHAGPVGPGPRRHADDGQVSAHPQVRSSR